MALAATLSLQFGQFICQAHPSSKCPEPAREPSNPSPEPIPRNSAVGGIGAHDAVVPVGHGTSVRRGRHSEVRVPRNHNLCSTRPRILLTS
jgi:hypothetical protein